MRSLFAKILMWFLGTTILTSAGIALTTALVFEAEEPHRPGLHMMLSHDLEQARRAYEAGGSAALTAALERMRRNGSAQLALTDVSGRDLATGEDRKDLLKYLNSRPSPFNRPVVIGESDPQGRYNLFLIGRAHPWRLWFLRLEHLWVLGIAVLACYALAYHLSSPVLKLKRTVDRFGHGDLTARAASRRADEIGQLARSFNHMAEHIETLLVAERRLLLDISHELRSPLARLGVAVELARSGEVHDPLLDRIQKEADRLNTLIDGLLQVTRAEGDPGTRHVVPVQLDELLEDIVGDCSIEATALECALTLTSRMPMTVNGDPELLRRAIENVIRNAIRHAPAGTVVEVLIEARPEATGCILVRDSGPGVPPEALTRIFDPFYRVETDRGRSSGGAGLGLAIARRGVELHAGSLRAQNVEPGLLVTIELPLAPDSPAPVASDATVSSRS